ncbi:MAG: hypothetical protein QOJ51_5790, partial [Acidobacteriaceae bacterium]|nr:hypothetical protein [Acidobacteriaceae bacterium]
PQCPRNQPSRLNLSRPKDPLHHPSLPRRVDAPFRRIRLGKSFYTPGDAGGMLSRFPWNPATASNHSRTGTMGRRHVFRVRSFDLWNCVLLHASYIGRLLYIQSTPCYPMRRDATDRFCARFLASAAERSQHVIYVRADGNQPAASGDLPNASPNIVERQQLILHTKHRYKQRHFKRTLAMLV